jgi:hypothetical protein
MISRWPIGELIRLNNFPLSPGRWEVETDPPLPIKIKNLGRAISKGGATLAFQILSSTRDLNQPAPTSYNLNHEVLIRNVKITRVGAASTPIFEVSKSTIEAARRYEERQAQQKPVNLVLEDFEQTRPLGSKPIHWRTSGPAMTHITQGQVKHQKAITNYSGQSLLNSFHPTQRDRLVGRRWSQPLKLSQHHILSFKLGGGSLERKVGLRLWINGVAVSTWAGKNRESLSQHHLDLRAYPEGVIQLELIDEATGSWGHLLADDFRLSADLVGAIGYTTP